MSSWNHYETYINHLKITPAKIWLVVFNFQDLGRRSIETGFWQIWVAWLKFIKFGHWSFKITSAVPLRVNSYYFCSDENTRIPLSFALKGSWNKEEMYLHLVLILLGNLLLIIHKLLRQGRLLSIVHWVNLPSRLQICEP